MTKICSRLSRQVSMTSSEKWSAKTFPGSAGMFTRVAILVRGCRGRLQSHCTIIGQWEYGALVYITRTTCCEQSTSISMGATATASESEMTDLDWATQLPVQQHCLSASIEKMYTHCLLATREPAKVKRAASKGKGVASAMVLRAGAAYGTFATAGRWDGCGVWASWARFHST